MFTFGMTTGPYGFDPLVLLLVALVVEAGVGEMRWLFRFVRHPVVILGAFVAFLDRKLNREKRSAGDRAVRGAMAVLLVCGAAGAIGWGVAWLSQHHTFGWILELLLLVILLAQRGLYDHVRAVGRALEREGLEPARRAVAHIVGRDPNQLDEHGVARAAIESLAENFSDAVVAPVFWYVLFGMPGLLVYKAANTMDSMIGHLTPQYQAFGMVAARFDDALNVIPARLAGLLIAIAASFTPKANPWHALKIMARDAGKHRSVNAGWPEGAMAGALNLALAGPRRYSQHVVNDPWVGSGSARATALDIRRALYLYIVACLINALWVAALAVVRLGFS
jgi:adenosylcobinamide-phosphate synthase